MKDIKLIKASAIIDFYVSKKRYNSFKKDRSKKRYVEEVLFNYLESLVSTTKNGCEIRYCRVSSNNFWGNELLFINDLGYSFANQKEKREDDKLPIRVFQVELIGINVDDAIEKYEDIVDENFLISFSSVISI